VKIAALWLIFPPILMGTICPAAGCAGVGRPYLADVHGATRRDRHSNAGHAGCEYWGFRLWTALDPYPWNAPNGSYLRHAVCLGCCWRDAARPQPGLVHRSFLFAVIIFGSVSYPLIMRMAQLRGRALAGRVTFHETLSIGEVE